MARPSPQKRFVFGSLACKVCPYGISGRCDGETSATPESFILTDSSVIGCLDPARQRAHFADLHGQLRPLRQKSRHSEINLPAFIPQICTGLGALPKLKGDPLFAVSLSTILGEEGKVKYRSAQSLRHALGLQPDARLALIGTTNDYTIEKLWTNSGASDAWNRIANLGFEFSTSVSYSVWDEHPRFDQIFNQEKNFATHGILLEKGIISIPFLFFYDEKDYQEILSWLRNHKDVRKVAILAQFKRADANFEEVVVDMHRLEKDLSRSLQFLVVGPSTASRIRRLFNEFSRVTIVTIEPAFKALYSHRALRDLRYVPADNRIRKAIIAANNIEIHRKFCARARPAKRVRRLSDEVALPLLSRISV
jgi:hypothetical protein